MVDRAGNVAKGREKANKRRNDEKGAEVGGDGSIGRTCNCLVAEARDSFATESTLSSCSGNECTNGSSIFSNCTGNEKDRESSATFKVHESGEWRLP